jgi:dimeric dUTPase (all-alpha-NTP-PPase superfamily)
MANSPENAASADMLRSIFAMQAELNDYVFKKNDLRDNEGRPLNMQAITDQVELGRLSVNDIPNQWLNRYAKAMSEELEELKHDLLWKWWSKDTIDIQNIRVELVDILHFLVSAMLCAGLTADRLHDVYRQKHAINLARQDSGYSQATKTEDDNRTIK